MSIFNVTNFERQGNNEQDIHLSSLEEIQNAVIEIADQALIKIQIFTPNLEANIYNNEQFSKGILNLARGNRQAQIHILVTDSSQAIKNGHGIIRLAQQLTSSVEIRIPPEEYQNENISFILIDNQGFLLKPDSKVNEAIYSTSCKYRSKKLQEAFTYVWNQSVPDPQIRRLMI